MTDHLIQRVGSALFGERWQTDMAKALKVSDRTVRRWAAGSDEPRPGVYSDLQRLAIERVSELEALMDELKIGPPIAGD